MKEEEESHNIFNCFKPFGCFMKLFGMFPMSIKDLTLKPGPLDVIVTIASLGVYVFLVATSLNQTNTFIVNNTTSIALGFSSQHDDSSVLED